LASKKQQSQPQQNKIQVQFFQPNFQIKAPATIGVDKSLLLIELIDE
jgi:hypothetical protein